MANNLPFEEVQKFISRSVLGKDCWYVSAGVGTGSRFILSLGGKRPRTVLLKNAYHSVEYQQFEGEISLSVECTWRLDSSARPITSSDHDAEVLARELRNLVGQRVLDIKVLSRAGDLCITFSADLCLRIFCDNTNGDSAFESNWHLTTEQTRLVMGPGYGYEVQTLAE